MVVSIIILTLNNWELTERCLDSIERYTPIPYELVCVDNGSTDGTQDRLRYRGNVRLISNESNRGFAGACNQGIAASGGDTILLLNNDTMVSHRWLENLIQALYSSPDVGMVGPVSNMVLPLQRMPMSYSTTGEYHEFAQTFNRHNPLLWRSTSALSGFCMLFRRQLIDQIGMLDEAYQFGGFEDIDFGYRTLRAGLKLLIAGDTHVHHEGNASFLSNAIDMAGQGQINREVFLKKWNLNPDFLIHGEGSQQSHLEGALLKGVSSHTIFLMENGFKRAFANEAAMARYRFKMNDVQLVNDAELERYPTGRILSADEPFELNSPSVMLLIGSGPTVFLRRGDTLHPFTSQQAMKQTNNDPDRIVSVSDDILARFKIGSIIQSSPIPDKQTKKGMKRTRARRRQLPRNKRYHRLPKGKARLRKKRRRPSSLKKRL